MMVKNNDKEHLQQYKIAMKIFDKHAENSRYTNFYWIYKEN